MRKDLDDKINMDMEKIGCENGTWRKLNQNRIQWQVYCTGDVEPSGSAYYQRLVTLNLM